MRVAQELAIFDELDAEDARDFGPTMSPYARALALVDRKYGLDIEVPGAVILTTFGFEVKGLPGDLVGLGVVTGVCLLLGYGAMHLLLVERR